MMADRIVSDDGHWMWTGSEWIPMPPRTAENNNQTSGKEKVEIEEISKMGILFVGLIVFGLLGVIVFITSSSNQGNNETYIQWTNVDDCLFQVELVASEGLVYREIVDYSDRVWWEGLDQHASKPYTFTISNTFTNKDINFAIGKIIKRYFAKRNTYMVCYSFT